MSGGSFDYVCYKVEDERILTALSDVRNVETYLRSISKHDAADEVLLFIKEVETHQRRLAVIGKRISFLLRAAEWTCSGDTSDTYIDNEYKELMGIKPQEAAQ